MQERALLATRLDRLIGPKSARAFETAFGYETAADLLQHFPRRYLRRGELTPIDEIPDGSEATILAQVLSAKSRRIPGRKGGLLEVIVTDGKAKLALTFFNQVWRERDLRPGKQGLFAGKITLFNGKRQLTHPEYQLIPDGDDVDGAIDGFAGKLIPIYPATSKLPSWKIEQAMAVIIDSLSALVPPEASTLKEQSPSQVEDLLSKELLEELGLPSRMSALISVHRPKSVAEAESAKERLTFDEALILQLILMRRRNSIRRLHARRCSFDGEGILGKFDQVLPYELTEGQRRVSAEIASDLEHETPMYRLLQGEVGSGKTVVAIRAMLATVDSGGQAALLAPTEVLAQQHYQNLLRTLGPLAEAGRLDSATSAISVALLTGSLPTSEKSQIRERLMRGEIDLVIGTHALIAEQVGFKNLAMVVIDEQHRFGVEQRDALRSRSDVTPHVLVMTATPIPRTVAMTVFGDLDVSILDQLPQGRSAIATHLIPVLAKPHFLERAWQRILEEVSKGRQGYVVAPRIDQKDSLTDVTFGLTNDVAERAAKLVEEDGDVEIDREMASVAEFYQLLKDGPLKSIRIAPLHGKMTAEAKAKTMQSFQEGEIDLLISTTVIEVGVDVPNATVMVILDADRFGVSQLHQLRGRVGRGAHPGLCLLVTRAEENSPAIERLNAVASTLDGFELARLDLEQRREGDVLGATQSGTRSHLRLLRVLADEEVIIKAREIAQGILERDPELLLSPYLAEVVQAMEAESEAAFVEKG
ncbi:MAG: ATP-dependent DNA helicase RecG [Actinobacteria bacterium]|nr:ATP-dependent DNA helicase RecG [Actinomycetota bacterium]